MPIQAPTSNAKRPTNLSINSELLEEAKSLGINISRSAESGIQNAVTQTKREQWLRDNKSALESSNRFVEMHGLPLANFRQF